MENFKNRIITISGDPASGKGSVTKELVNLYTAAGFKVTKKSVGDIFREVAVEEYKKKFPKIENPSLEEIQSNPDFAAELEAIDLSLDSRIKKLGEDFNSKARPNEILIVDSRLAWFNIPDSFAVRLTVDPQTAGERVFNDPKRGKEDKYPTVEAAIQDTATRKALEIERYIKQYGADLTKPENFKLIIDTTLASIRDIAKTIQICEQREQEGKAYAKTWASPELFYPTQPIGDTWSKGSFTAGFTPQELADLIKQNGIYPDSPVSSTAILDSSYHFVADGHHRVYASIMAGLTLIPYRTIKTTNKATVSSQRSLSNIYDHEDSIAKPDGTAFRYAKYPEIDDRAEEHDFEW